MIHDTMWWPIKGSSLWNSVLEKRPKRQSLRIRQMDHSAGHIVPAPGDANCTTRDSQWGHSEAPHSWTKPPAPPSALSRFLLIYCCNHRWCRQAAPPGWCTTGLETDWRRKSLWYLWSLGFRLHPHPRPRQNDGFTSVSSICQLSERYTLHYLITLYQL